MNQDAKSYYGAAAQLPQEVADLLLRVPPEVACRVTEIRLRSGRPVTLSTAQENLFVSAQGRITYQPDDTVLRTSHTAVGNCFHALCAYSVHSYQTCIAQGFVPLSGGHRAGVCGTAVVDGQGVATVKNITSINIRIARAALRTCSPALCEVLAQPGGILLAGAPGSGKTTLLRAVMHALSAQGQRVAAVDERFEIAPVEQAGFAVEMPLHCDVLSGYPKHVGMLHALRSLAPDVLLCDEIGSMDDVHAVQCVANAGVRMIVTLHGDDPKTLCSRPQVQALLATGAFSYLVLLAGKQAPGEIGEVVSLAVDA